MQKISPFFWFDGQAEAAANYYVSIFSPNSKIKNIRRLDEASSKAAGSPVGSALVVQFQKFC